MPHVLHKIPQKHFIEPAYVQSEACRILGHIKTPIYVEEDGHCDEFYCKRCGEQV